MDLMIESIVGYELLLIGLSLRFNGRVSFASKYVNEGVSGLHPDKGTNKRMVSVSKKCIGSVWELK
ncbi:MAG: hypothetical protein CR994_07655 [Maribacter sp.]|nr:MAG: hypothetical protein CR994_07655 [Maribacter sp.]